LFGIKRKLNKRTKATGYCNRNKLIKSQI